MESDDPGNKWSLISATRYDEHNIRPYRQVDVDWRTYHEHAVSVTLRKLTDDRYGIKGHIPNRQRNAAISDIRSVYSHLMIKTDV
jgi:hypothetical protein